MNRLLLCLALIAALVSVQALSLHAHLNVGDEAQADAAILHFHSHNSDPAHHGEAEPGIDGDAIDLLTSTAARDSGGLHIDLAVAMFLTLFLVVVWRRHPQRSSARPPARYTKPSYRRPSPRAPPLPASLF